MPSWLWDVILTFNLVVLAYFILLNGSYIITSLFAFSSLRRYANRLKSLDIDSFIISAGAPPITLLAPAYNEEETCVQSVKSLLTLNYQQIEIIVVNDGSTDDTLDRLIAAFNLSRADYHPTANIPSAEVRAIYGSGIHPNLWVVDKENGGKADALNSGLNHCRTPLFCALDADSLLERDALVRIVRPFMEDASTIAAGGIIRVINDCTVKSGQVTDIRLPRKLLPRFQVLEYLRAFLSGRMGWDALQATLIISGAFGIFRRSTVVEAGGYAPDTVGEDMELIVRMHRYAREEDIPYRIAFVPDPVAWTEVPDSLKQLGRQRDRWQRGLTESLLMHRKMLMNPRYGRIGMLAYPYFFFLEMLGPVVEVGGYIAFAITVLLGRASPLYTVAFLVVAIVLGIVLSVLAVGLEELTFRRYPRIRDLLSLFGLAVLENFGYRQMTTFWRIRGTLNYLRRRKDWGEMERRGFAEMVNVTSEEERDQDDPAESGSVSGT